MSDGLTYDARAIPSTFGGGWIVPLTRKGGSVLTAYFGEPKAPLAPLDGEQGWIVEPAQAAELTEVLKEAGLSWRTD